MRPRRLQVSCATGFQSAVAIFFLALLSLTSAEALDPSRLITQYIHDNWEAQDGLPQNSVQAITQTNDGYLWFGTQEGLVRFDGANFTVYDRRLHPEWLSHDVIALLQDRNGVLWIGTIGGGVIRLQDGVFSRITMEDGLSSNYIRCLLEDRKGAIWIGTDTNGLNRWENGTITRVGIPDGLSHQFVRSLAEDSDGSLWIGTDGGGLNRLKQGKITVYRTGEGLPNDYIGALKIDSQGRLWIGTIGGGLTILRDGKFQTFGAPLLSNLAVRALAQDRRGTLWIGTEGGLCRFGSGRFDCAKAGLISKNFIMSLYEDRESNLWIGTYSAGLNRLKDGSFVTFTTDEGLTNDDIWTVLGDSQGGIWIGTIGGGVNYLKDGKVTVLSTSNGLPNDFIRALHLDPDGTLWIGTNGGGLVRVQNGAITTFSEKDGLSSNFVRSILRDRNGVLWIGTNGAAINRFQNGQFQKYGKAEGIENDFVRQILEDRNGTLWVATDGGGLHFLDRRMNRFIVKPISIRKDIAAFCLYEDREGTLWLGTSGSGLSRIRNGQVTTYDSSDGLFSDTIFSIQEDEAANLWMSCNKGIFRVSKKDLEAYDRGDRVSISNTVFGMNDGMRSGECSGGTMPSSWKDGEGRMWFPTVKGVAVIHPEKSSQYANRIAPPVHIEKIVVDGKETTVNSNSTAIDPFPPGDGTIEIHFTALSLVVPERVRFRYRLDEFHTGWVDSDTRRIAYFTNVPPGEYVFRVIACNNDGVWNEEGVTLAFVLRPHFYQTHWFYGLCLILAGLTVVGAVRLRERQLRNRQAELARMVDEKTRDLLSARSQLERANQNLEAANRTLERRVQEGIDALRQAEQMAAYGRLVAGVAHEVRHPVFALQAAAYVLKEKLGGREDIQSQLRTIDRETRRMSLLTDDLLEFARPPALLLSPTDPVQLLKEAEETYRAGQDPNKLPVVIDAANEIPRVRLDRGRVLQVILNLMNNAGKHARGATRIRLTAEPAPEEGGETAWIRFTVEDDGCGMDKSRIEQIFEPFFTTGKGTGLGLSIAKRIISDHDGRIDVDSAPAKGTRFRILLPAEGPEERKSDGNPQSSHY